MNAQNQNGYMLLYRSDEWYKRLSHAELRKLMNQNKAWIERLTAQGKPNLAARLSAGARSFPALTDDSLPTDHLLNPRKPLADIWCWMSKQWTKPLPLRRAARAWLTAVQSKYGPSLMNVPSTFANANWREKNNLQPFKFNSAYVSTTSYKI